MNLDLAQPALPLDEFEEENPHFLTDQLITYIGNKRSLLKPIENAVAEVSDRLDRPLTTLDAFSGSGVVSRALKSRSSLVIANDLEPYARVLAECYLSNREEVPWARLAAIIDEFNAIVDSAASTDGFIERLYSPRDDDAINLGERVFYTRDNARRLDHYAQLIQGLDAEVRSFVLAPLLSAASIHANTAGVFKGFYKDKATGIGRFGGAGEDALSRIKGKIRLRLPVMSEFKTDIRVYCQDANSLVRELDHLDLAYFDPPYNQHPYGSNYFMLNLLVDYREPTQISSVSGIPVDWQRSKYNVKRESLPLMRDLATNTDARFLLISFNDEGYIEPSDMLGMLNDVGRVTEFRTTYNAFRGSRNLRDRAIHVTEHLYLVEKG